MQQGWIKLHRAILESDLWHDVTTFRIFSYLLLRATHKDGVKVEGLELKRGQWVRSYRKLAKDLAYKHGRGLKEYSLKTIQKSIGKLVDAQRITVEETEWGTLFTIVNYAEYQGFEGIEKEMGNGMAYKWETQNEEMGNKNKNASINKNAKKKDYTSKIKDLLTVYSAKIPDFVQLNKEYWDVIKETRTTGKLAESVIYNTMKKWEKYDPVVIQYALKTHIEVHAGKRENYTLGIMRNTPKEEAEDRLNRKNNVVNDWFAKKERELADKPDPRDIEIAYNKWCAAGNNPDLFDWRTGKGINK